MYDAFISYSQKADRGIAQALRSVIQTIGKPWWKLRSLNVFLDATSLSAAPGLWPSIEAKLGQSRYLILLASPDAAASKWVDREVAHFIGSEGKGIDRLLIGLTEGELAWDEASGDFRTGEQTPLPPSLRGAFKAEPLWVDLRAFRGDTASATKGNQTFLRAALDLAATIKGVEKADLYSEELRQQRRSLRLAYGAAVVLAGLGVGAGVAAWVAVDNANRATAEATRAGKAEEAAVASEARATSAQQEAVAQRDEAEKQRAEAESQRTEAVTQRAEAVNQRAEAERQSVIAADNARRAEAETARAKEALGKALAEESDRVAAIAQQLTSGGEASLAKGLLMQVMPRTAGEDDRPITTASVAALERAVRRDREIGRRAVSGVNLFRLVVNKDETMAVTGANNGSIQFWSLPDLVLRHSAKSQEDIVSSLEISPDQRSVLVAGDKIPSVWDMATGKKRFDLKVPDPVRFIRMARYSPDGTLIATGGVENRVLIFRADDGAFVRSIQGPDFDVSRAIAGAKAEAAGAGFAAADPIIGAVANAQFQIWGAMTDIAFSPDGKTVAAIGAADPEAAIRLYDVATGLLRVTASGPHVALFGGSPGYGDALLFSASGDRVAEIAAGDAIEVFNTSDGQLQRVLAASATSSFLISADGRVIISGHRDGSIGIWCADDGRLVMTRRSHREEIENLVFSSDQSTFATSSSDGNAAVWPAPASEDVCAVQPLPDREARLDAIAPLAIFEGHRARVGMSRFLAKDTRLLTVSRDSTLRLWSVNERGVVPTEVTKAGETSVADLWSYRAEPRITFVGDGSRFLLNGQKEYKAALLGMDGRIIAEIDGDRIAHARAGGLMRVYPWSSYDPPTLVDSDGKQSAEPAGEDSAGHGRKYPWSGLGWEISPDDRFAISGDELEKPYSLYDAASGRPLAPLSIDGGIGKLHRFTADSRRVVAKMQKDDESPGGKTEYFLAAWDTESHRLIGRSPKLAGDFRFALSDDGGVALAYLADFSPPDFHQFSGDVLFRLSADGFTPVRLTIEGTRGRSRAVQVAALSPDGGLVAAGHSDGSILVWNTDGSPVAEFSGAEASIDAIAISADHKYLAAADIANTVWLYDLASGFAIASPALPSPVLEMRFQPGGDRLVVLTAHGLAYIILPSPIPGLPDDPAALLDWVRASQPEALAADERRRYRIEPPPLLEGPGLAALKPMPFAAPPDQPETSGKVAACDAVASNPFDRYARAKGTVYEQLDAQAALQVCAEALAEAPDDVTTIYQNGRLQDRLGHYREAMEFYRRAAEHGYGVALRGIARLIEFDKSGAFADLGPSLGWTERAAAAGDRLSLTFLAAPRGACGQYRYGAVLRACPWLGALVRRGAHGRRGARQDWCRPSGQATAGVLLLHARPLGRRQYPATRGNPFGRADRPRSRRGPGAPPHHNAPRGRRRRRLSGGARLAARCQPHRPGRLWPELMRGLRLPVLARRP